MPRRTPQNYVFQDKYDSTRTDENWVSGTSQKPGRLNTIALAHPRDDDHDIAKRRLAALSLQGERLVTTCAVLAEACHLLLAANAS